MSGLTAIFGNSDEDAPDNEKLLHLYWNRNELKKEFAGLRKEQFRLKDNIQRQEGATARLQQRIDHLENLLIDPEWSRSVTVFYQLRGVALRCEKMLERFAEQIKQQREQKQNKKQFDAWNDRLGSESSAIGAEVFELRNNIQHLEDQRQSESLRLQALNGFFRYFKRRSIAINIDDLAAKIQLNEMEEAGLQAQLDEIQARTPPDTLGLDIPAKRSINFMIIAYAQQLHIQFDDDTLLGLVKEASEKSVGSVNYGSESECAALLKRIFACRKSIDGFGDIVDILQKRAKLIGAEAQFQNAGDAVPDSASVATLFKINQHGSIRKSDANLLGDNYWRIANILSR